MFSIRNPKTSLRQLVMQAQSPNLISTFCVRFHSDSDKKVARIITDQRPEGSDPPGPHHWRQGTSGTSLQNILSLHLLVAHPFSEPKGKSSHKNLQDLHPMNPMHDYNFQQVLHLVVHCTGNMNLSSATAATRICWLSIAAQGNWF